MTQRLRSRLTLTAFLIAGFLVAGALAGSAGPGLEPEPAPSTDARASRGTASSCPEVGPAGAGIVESEIGCLIVSLPESLEPEVFYAEFVEASEVREIQGLAPMQPVGVPVVAGPFSFGPVASGPDAGGQPTTANSSTQQSNPPPPSVAAGSPPTTIRNPASGNTAPAASPAPGTTVRSNPDWIVTWGSSQADHDRGTRFADGATLPSDGYFFLVAGDASSAPAGVLSVTWRTSLDNGYEDDGYPWRWVIENAPVGQHWIEATVNESITIRRTFRVGASSGPAQPTTTTTTPAAGPTTTTTVPPPATTTTTTTTTTLPQTAGPSAWDYDALVGSTWNQAWITAISNDAVFMYYRFPGMDGLIDAYRATGNTTHIDRAVSMANTYLAKGRDVNSDGYLDWYSSWINGYSHFHVEWRAADGVAALVGEIFSNSSLSGYRSEVGALVDFLAEDAWAKWSLENGYYDYPHFIGRPGLIVLALWKATGDSTYKDYIESRGGELRNQIYSSGSNFFDTDVSHLGDAVAFMAEAHLAGLVFSRADMQHLADIVKDTMWNGSTTAPQFRDYPSASAAFGRSGQHQGGWTKLAWFDSELEAIYHTWAATDDIHPNYWIQAQIYGALARAASL